MATAHNHVYRPGLAMGRTGHRVCRSPGVVAIWLLFLSQSGRRGQSEATQVSSMWGGQDDWFVFSPYQPHRQEEEVCDVCLVPAAVCVCVCVCVCSELTGRGDEASTIRWWTPTRVKKREKALPRGRGRKKKKGAGGWHGQMPQIDQFIQFHWKKYNNAVVRPCFVIGVFV